MKEKSLRKSTGVIGILAVTVFIMALLIFGSLNPNFQFSDDYVSKLGAKGESYAIWWNLIGFLLIGILLCAFGWFYGKIIEDKLVGVLLALFGVGFAFTAIPIDMENETSSLSKAHIVAICLALAFWLFGLARISSNTSLSSNSRYIANIAAFALVSSMLGSVLDLWSMPITHRLVFGIVFGWTAITAIGLFSNPKRRLS